MFVARKWELQLLEDCLASESFQMVPVWGRRRVGKTRLLNEFARGKGRVHFFTAGETTAQENLARLSAAVLSWYDPDAIGLDVNAEAPVFPSFEAALSKAFSEATEIRTILIIDEYPYLAKSYPGISSLLQRLIDANKDSSRLMLILCGSSMSFMEEQVLGEKSPLYGRRASQMKVEPFDYLDSALMLGSDDPVRAVELVSLVGGIPLYLEQLDASRSTEWNIANRLLGQGRFLYAEPKSFLLQEVSSPAPYMAVIDALAAGRTKPAEVADVTGIAGPNAIDYLKKLGGLGIVSRETPVGRAKKKQVSYRICDNLFRFWHSFVPRYGQAIELGQEPAVARRIVQRDLNAFVGHAFESLCREWLMRQIADGRIDILPLRIGRWWGTDVIARMQANVDVVALGADGELVCGECKWTKEPVGADTIELLAQRAVSVAEAPKTVSLYVFSKSGFADSARREADRLGNVRLVDLHEMFLEA